MSRSATSTVTRKSFGTVLTRVSFSRPSTTGRTPLCRAGCQTEAGLREVALCEREDLFGDDFEHERFAAFMVEGAVRHLEVPVPHVLGLPCPREAAQELSVGHPLGVSFDHNVESRLPFVVASGERAVRAPRQVDALLLGDTGAEA